MRKILAGEEVLQAVIRKGRSGFEVAVDGERHALALEETAPGVYFLRRGEGGETFHCVRAGEEIHLFWRGAVYRLREEAEGGRSSQRHSSGALEAPMPGKVIKVNVSVGQAVAKGDEVLVIEAMKMENGLRAPRAGVVTAVSVVVGDMVSPGVALVEIA